MTKVDLLMLSLYWLALAIRKTMSKKNDQNPPFHKQWVFFHQHLYNICTPNNNRETHGCRCSLWGGPSEQIRWLFFASFWWQSILCWWRLKQLVKDFTHISSSSSSPPQLVARSFRRVMDWKSMTIYPLKKVCKPLGSMAIKTLI